MSSDNNDTARAADERQARGLTRRDFVAAAGGLGVGAVVAGGAVGLATGPATKAFAVSGGYLLVDSKKCGTCQTCMLACSVAHTGKMNLSLSRIQVGYNALGRFPYDSVQNQCHQCVYPACVDACPTGANHVDAATGVRMVDASKCIGCQRCIYACPYSPSRCQWNYEERHSQKCDLCIDTPYFDLQGGPGGHQACVEACPMRAIKFTTQVPDQKGNGYDVNLRNVHWANIGFPIDDAGRVLPSVSDPAANDEAAKAAKRE